MHPHLKACLILLLFPVALVLAGCSTVPERNWDDELRDTISLLAADGIHAEQKESKFLELAKPLSVSQQGEYTIFSFVPPGFDNLHILSYRGHLVAAYRFYDAGMLHIFFDIRPGGYAKQLREIRLEQAGRPGYFDAKEVRQRIGAESEWETPNEEEINDPVVFTSSVLATVQSYFGRNDGDFTSAKILGVQKLEEYWILKVVRGDKTKILVYSLPQLDVVGEL